MRIICAIITVAVLAACGADGEPERPTMKAGVSVSNSGVRTSTSVGFKLGGANILLGFGG